MQVQTVILSIEIVLGLGLSTELIYIVHYPKRHFWVMDKY